MAEQRFLRLAVIGDPVDHSRSPAIGRELLAHARRPGSYEAIRVAAGHGASAIAALRAQGYAGLNVTTPLKEEAYACSDRRDATALATGSVNTLVFGDEIRGYNTDGIGTLGVLRDAGLAHFDESHILVLGAGPTARAAIVALTEAGARVAVWNRTAERARAVAAGLCAAAFSPHDRYDAVLAAIAPGAALEDDDLIAAVRAAPLLVDANYGERATLARTLARPGFDGGRMLEHSARASFELWLRAARA